LELAKKLESLQVRIGAGDGDADADDTGEDGETMTVQEAYDACAKKVDTLVAERRERVKCAIIIQNFACNRRCHIRKHGPLDIVHSRARVYVRGTVASVVPYIWVCSRLCDQWRSASSQVNRTDVVRRLNCSQ
jgi:hypothetical protein